MIWGRRGFWLWRVPAWTAVIVVTVLAAHGVQARIWTGVAMTIAAVAVHFTDDSRSVRTSTINVVIATVAGLAAVLIGPSGVGELPAFLAASRIAVPDRSRLGPRVRGRRHHRRGSGGRVRVAQPRRGAGRAGHTGARPTCRRAPRTDRVAGRGAGAARRGAGRPRGRGAGRNVAGARAHRARPARRARPQPGRAVGPAAGHPGDRRPRERRSVRPGAAGQGSGAGPRRAHRCTRRRRRVTRSGRVGHRRDRGAGRPASRRRRAAQHRSRPPGHAARSVMPSTARCKRRSRTRRATPRAPRSR